MTDEEQARTQSVVLVKRAQAGDEVARNELFERYYPRVYHIVRGRMGSLLRRFAQPEDLVQETFGAALRSFDRFEVHHEASLIHWLARLAENQIRDAAKHLNTAKNDPGREVPLADSRSDVHARSNALANRLAASITGVPDKLIRTEMLEALHESLEALSEEQRELILLRDFAGGSWEFVAQEVGRPSAHAAMEAYRRAKTRLAQSLGPRIDP